MVRQSVSQKRDKIIGAWRKFNENRHRTRRINPILEEADQKYGVRETIYGGNYWYG